VPKYKVKKSKLTFHNKSETKFFVYHKTWFGFYYRTQLWYETLKEAKKTCSDLNS